jgi:hypothetical protein
MSDDSDPDAELRRLREEEDELRRELAEARRFLRVERAAGRPPTVTFGPLGVGLFAFLAFLTTSGCIRCLGVWP